MFDVDWNDVRSAKESMEQHYVGSVEAGSACFQYLMDHPASKWPASRGREKHLATYELNRWLLANNITCGFAYGPELDTEIFYREYDRPGRLNKSLMRRKPSKRGKLAPKDKATGSRSNVTERGQSAPRGKTTGSISNARVQKPKKPVRSKVQKRSHGKSVPRKTTGPRMLPTDATLTRTLRPRGEHRRVKSEFFHPDERRLKS